MAKRTKSAAKTPHLSRYDCYEACVQNPAALVPLLRAIHANNPRRLGEDFCGSAALSRTWLAQVPGSTAIGIDLDPEPLARAKSFRSRKLTLIKANVLKLPAAARAKKSDAIFVGNFSIGELHTRADLIKYLRSARARLARGGVFICDTYGGETAFSRGSFKRTHPGPHNTRIHYTWQQRECDPLTARVENALHFRVEHAGEIVQEFTDAFIYRWRLWSVPELRDALRDAGFSSTDVYEQLPDAMDTSGNAMALPLDGAEAEPSFIVCVAARA